MFVIVEGIDRVGKTTLCEKLARFGFITLKDAFGATLNNGKPKGLFHADGDDFPVYSIGKIDTAIQYIKSLSDKGFNIVADRLQLTELVYGSLDRATCVREEKIKSIEKMIYEMFGADVMLVLVKPVTLEGACERAGRDLSSHNKMFEEAFFESYIPLKFTTNFYHLAQMVDTILSYTFEFDFYFASPFFRPDQIEREERLKAHLRHMGYSVFSPRESCVLDVNASSQMQSDVFIENVFSIKKARAVFAITDTKDVGTIWEAGYAFALGKPIVYYAETLGDNPFNVMLSKSGRAVFTNQNEVTKHRLDNIIRLGFEEVYKGGVQ